MADKLKLALVMPKVANASDVFAVNVEITNTTTTPITIRSVDPQLVPGTLLPLQDKWQVTELDQLEQRKQALVGEMEHQLALAYGEIEREEEQESRDWWKRASEFVLALTGGMLVVRLAQVASGVVFAAPDEVPAWAKESARIENWEDVVRAEKDVISLLPESAKIKKAFLIDKQKLESCLESISIKTEIESQGVSLERSTVVEPGETFTFPFRCRAKNTYRRQTCDIGFQVRWTDDKTGKAGKAGTYGSVELVPSSRVVSLGAVLGAASGVVIRWSFVEGPKTWTKAALQVFGAVFLAILVAVAVAKKPGSNKPLAVEDFLGGFLVGGLAGIYSTEILGWLKSLLPAASSRPQPGAFRLS